MDISKIGYMLANVPIRHEIGAHSHLSTRDHIESLRKLLPSDNDGSEGS